ncbi:type I DNA topoisomerase [Tistrella bauzanensis]|uniref:type I DNA topoisomerase n=1 Tax=Tistrella TaxID=171436 RepID=UPI0031F674DC
MKVVVVESPAKAKTINKYLGDDFRVLASYGHVSDLPAKDGSVRPDEDFAMTYEVDPKSEQHLKAIVSALKGADQLFLATDPDREGEAISWHVHNALEKRGALKGVPVKRVVFHEITKTAVQKAIANPRDIDMNLVNAQQARRALDYLVGFNLSPVLWRKLPGSRSAGRVQSVALRLICEREAEIEAFRTREYWTIDAEFAAGERRLMARLTALDGEKLDKFALGSETAAMDVVGRIESLSGWRVSDVERKQGRRNPAPPFTTSTLQQEASRKLGFSAKKTMQVAQKLYEGIALGRETVGLITYMRTDSVNLSNEAVAAIRDLVDQVHGTRYLPDRPRSFANKAKNAQEAHEAVRPTDVFRRPKEVRSHLDDDQFRLYELIWKRTVASQMAQALLDQVAIEVVDSTRAAMFRATGSVIAFDGFLTLYQEGRDDEEEDEEKRLPSFERAEPLDRGPIKPDQHFTEPPPRYTEATLVKKLEELGIGRPSTYASIISVLQDRDYVVLDKKRFVPEDRGWLVTAFLVSFFDRYVEYDFTARLESELDRVADGDVDWKSVLRAFWQAFHMAIDGTSDLKIADVLTAVETRLERHVFPDREDGSDPRACPACANGRLSLRLGKFGSFVACSNYPDCKFTRPVGGAAGTGDGASEAGATGLDVGPKHLGDDPATGLPVTLRKGPYGIYVQLGEGGGGEKPKRASLPKGLTAEAVTLDIAVGLLALPRDIGTHPETGEMITAGIGRFGPYLRHNGAYKSLTGDDDVLTIGINRAVALLAEAPKGRGGGITPLRVLGEHPQGGEIALYKGRYGPYVKHGAVNATLPKATEPEALTLDEAIALVDARAAATGKTRKAPARTASAKKSTAAKKAPAKAAANKADGADTAGTAVAAKVTKTAAKRTTKTGATTAGATKAGTSKPAAAAKKAAKAMAGDDEVPFDGAVPAKTAATRPKAAPRTGGRKPAAGKTVAG